GRISAASLPRSHNHTRPMRRPPTGRHRKQDSHSLSSRQTIRRTAAGFSAKLKPLSLWDRVKQRFQRLFLYPGTITADQAEPQFSKFLGSLRSLRKHQESPGRASFHRHRLTPQQNPETLSLWLLRHPISSTAPG